MTARQRLAAAAVLSGSFFGAFAISYYAVWAYPLAVLGIILVIPWAALRLTRRAMALSANEFPSRSLAFGLGGALAISGVVMPYGPPLESFGLERAGLPFQVLALLLYFSIGMAGAFAAAWALSHVTVVRTGSSAP